MRVHKPKMIIFDYGQTLVAEEFDGLKGNKAILLEASSNPQHVSAEEIQTLAIKLNEEIGRFGSDYAKYSVLEVHDHIFQNYLYEYFDIQFTKSRAEMERIFEEASCSGEPTKNIEIFLAFLAANGIRTGVISNISFSGELLNERIVRYIPSHQFEFAMASSEYIFRKPHRRIFELALRKAKLDPADVWYCGDNAVFDVDGAADCGIYPVWYKGALDKSNKHIPRNTCLEVADWLELMDILRHIESREKHVTL